MLPISFGQKLFGQFVTITVLPGGQSSEPHQARLTVVARFDAAIVSLVAGGPLHIANIFQHRHNERLTLFIRQIIMQPVIGDQCALPRIVIPFGQNPRTFRQINELNRQLQPVIGFFQILIVACAQIDQRAFQRFGAAMAFQTVSHGILVTDVAFENHLTVNDVNDICFIFQFDFFRKAINFLFQPCKSFSASAVQTLFERWQRIRINEQPRM